MGLFGCLNIKMTAHDFLKTQLDILFSSDFAEAEKNAFAVLATEIPLLGSVDIPTYVNERRNVTFNLLEIAWERNIPPEIFVKYSGAMAADPRVKTLDDGVYHCSFSRSLKTGLSIFEFMSKVFIARIISPDSGMSDDEYSNLYVKCGTDFTRRYRSFENSIRHCEFVK